MNRVSLILSALILAGVCRGNNAATVRLRPTRIDADELRPGFGVNGAIPAAGYRARIAGTDVTFLDLDGDGKLETNGDDGCILERGRFVIRLDDFLLLAAGQFHLSFSAHRRGWRLELTEEELDVPTSLLRLAAVITRLRAAAGRPLARIDADASKACRLHLAYLAQNPDQKGVQVHFEYPQRRGFTRAGRLAAGRSCIYPEKGSFAAALKEFYRTVWHGFPITDPRVTAFGVAAGNNICMLYPYKRRNVDANAIICSPSDGQVDVPINFAFRGEIPNPIPGDRRANGKGCGFPVLLLVPKKLADRALAKVELRPAGRRGKRGDPVAGTISCPQNPVNPKYNPTNFGLAVFVPNSQLQRRTTYHVAFHFNDSREPITWQFKTEDGM